MSKRTIIVAGVMVLAALATGLTQESAGETSRDRRSSTKEHSARGLAGELGLSAEKRAEMKERMQEMREKMVELNSVRDAAKADFERLLEADSIDESAVLQAVDKLTQATGDIMKARVKAKIAISKMLTPEQKARMKELRQRMKQRRTERIAKWRENRSARGRRNKWRSKDSSENGDSDVEPHRPAFEPEEPF